MVLLLHQEHESGTLFFKCWTEILVLRCNLYVCSLLTAQSRTRFFAPQSNWEQVKFKVRIVQFSKQREWHGDYVHFSQIVVQFIGIDMMIGDQNEAKIVLKTKNSFWQFSS